MLRNLTFLVSSMYYLVNVTHNSLEKHFDVECSYNIRQSIFHSQKYKAFFGICKESDNITLKY